MVASRLGAGVTGLGVLALVASSCGGVAPSTRPAPIDVKRELGDAKCEDVSAGGEPLIVDWRPDRRGALESSLGGQLAIVHYDCKRFELLEDCHAEGSYAFVGFEAKEQVLRLMTAEELRANLPLSGVGLAVDVGAEISRGASLDVAMSMVGRKSTTRTSLRRSDLRGSCEGATHFVRRAVLGAFAISLGTRAEASAAANVFGASAGAKAKLARLDSTKDGDLAACSGATPSSRTAPDKCGALLRVALVPLSETLDVATGPEETRRVAVCAKGLVSVGGKCTAPTTAAHVCRPGDVKDCVAQCEKGDGESCAIVGRYYRDELQPPDQARGREALSKSCELGHADGCASFGASLLYGMGGPKDEARAHELFKRACNQGAPRGCYNEAISTEGVQSKHFGWVDGVPEQVGSKVLALFERACDGGFWAGCSAAGVMHMEGYGISKDPPNAGLYRSRACDGGFANACSNYAYQLLNGVGVAKDEGRAFRFYERGCELNDVVGCGGLSALLYAGVGTPKDEARGAAVLKKACEELHSNWACEDLKRRSSQ